MNYISRVMGHISRTAALAFALPFVAHVGCPNLLAQGPPDGPGGGFGGHGGPRALMGPGGPMGGFHGKTVTGLPYAATLSNQVVQHLSDGDTITRKTTGTVARDSQGRTYEQVTLTGGPFGQTGTRTLVFISDPVAGFAYTLDAANKTAMQHTIHPPPTNTAIESNDMPQHQPKDVVTADLDADSSSGVPATGKSFTHTIAAGAIGNSQPIVAVTQVWTATDLQIVVKSQRNDPLSGESTYVLSNITPKEPDASLFKVPSGYTMKTESGHGRRGANGPPPTQE